MEYKNDLKEDDPDFSNFIVLFFDSKIGVVTKVISEKCSWPVGYFTKSWAMLEFNRCPVGTSTTFTDI